MCCNRVLRSRFVGRRGNLQGLRDGWCTRYPGDRVLHRNHTEQRVHSFRGLPQSVTSLVIKTDVFTLMEIRELLEQLPNLDDLSLPSFLVAYGAPRGLELSQGGDSVGDCGSSMLNSGSSTRLYGMRLMAALYDGAVRGQPSR